MDCSFDFIFDFLTVSLKCELKKKSMRFLLVHRILLKSCSCIVTCSLTLNSGMKRSDALNKNDSKQQAVLITDVLSGEEQGENYQLAVVQIYTERYARGTGGTEVNLNSSRVFFFFLPYSRS